MTTRVATFATGVLALTGLLWVAAHGPLLSGVAVGLAVLAVAALALTPTRLGSWLVVLALFTAPMNSVRPSAAVSFVTFSDLFFVVGFGLLLPRLLSGRFTLPPKYVLGAVILLVSGFLASLFAHDPVLSLNLMSRLVVASIGLPVLFLLWAPSARTVDVLAGAYVAGQVVSVGAALVNGTIDNGRYVGLTIHPNFFGMCAITALGLLLHLRHRVSRGWQWLLWVAAAANLAATVMSGSRAAIVLVALLAVLYPLVERSAVTAYVVVAAGIACLLLSNQLLGLAGQGSALQRLRGDSTAATSDSVRENAFQSGLADVRARPVFGNGFENALEAHNIYLQVTVSVGLVGLIGFLLMFSTLVQPLFARGPMHRLGYAAITYAIGGLLTASLWDRMVWAGLALAFLANLWPPEETDASDEHRDPEGGAEAPFGTLPDPARPHARSHAPSHALETA